MPRKGEVRKREVLPDPKFGDKLVTKFVNTIMNQGKKSVAESILYKSLDIVAGKTKEDSIGIFKKAIEDSERYDRQLRWMLRRLTPGQYLGLHLTLGLIAAGGCLWLFGGVVEDLRRLTDEIGFVPERLADLRSGV
jgi:glutathione S-transferase